MTIPPNSQSNIVFTEIHERIMYVCERYDILHFLLFKNEFIAANYVLKDTHIYHWSPSNRFSVLLNYPRVVRICYVFIKRKVQTLYSVYNLSLSIFLVYRWHYFPHFTVQSQIQCQSIFSTERNKIAKQFEKIISQEIDPL